MTVVDDEEKEAETVEWETRERERERRRTTASPLIWNPCCWKCREQGCATHGNSSSSCRSSHGPCRSDTAKKLQNTTHSLTYAIPWWWWWWWKWRRSHPVSADILMILISASARSDLTPQELGGVQTTWRNLSSTAGQASLHLYINHYCSLARSLA